MVVIDSTVAVAGVLLAADIVDDAFCGGEIGDVEEAEVGVGTGSLSYPAAKCCRQWCRRTTSVYSDLDWLVWCKLRWFFQIAGDVRELIAGIPDRFEIRYRQQLGLGGIVYINRWV